MEEKDIIGVILANPLFSAFNMSEIRDITRYFQRVNVKAGIPVFREGEIGDCMYFIIKGKVGIYKRKKDLGKNIESFKITDLHIGESVGELSIFDNYVRSASAIAETDCELLRLSRTEFEKMEKEHNDYAYKILKALLKIVSKRLRRTTDMVVDILKED
ncbi:MAG: cyclic nucleotide-binding domain-containing protein [Candidatus Calescibacterium sp.]|nr:cyclic nucleotide-binding domain-containing protein [Candidatus Calescibacterium sp.]MDW8088026.1 cyclic nucleotide-binding domain-containing protein [Candidatus Calescibacterium sp.]